MMIDSRMAARPMAVVPPPHLLGKVVLDTYTHERYFSVAAKLERTTVVGDIVNQRAVGDGQMRSAFHHNAAARSEWYASVADGHVFQRSLRIFTLHNMEDAIHCAAIDNRLCLAASANGQITCDIEIAGAACILILTRNGQAIVAARQLEPRYFVGVGTHTYLSTLPSEPLPSRYPDVALINRGGAAMRTASAPAVATPLVYTIPLPEPYEEPYLEVQLVPDGEVVTVIELLSHTNKRAGDERKSYLQKRKEYLSNDVHFVEIDLLRAGEPMPYTEHIPADYRIAIRRREHPLQMQLYPFFVRKPIPIFSLPLLPDDDEPPVDLGALLQNVYDRARYRLVIDYSKPPEPRLRPEDMEWAQGCLTA